MLLRLFKGLVVPSELPEAFKTCVDDATYQAHVEFLLAGLQTHTDSLEREAPSVKLTIFFNLNACFLVPDPTAQECVCTGATVPEIPRFCRNLKPNDVPEQLCMKFTTKQQYKLIRLAICRHPMRRLGQSFWTRTCFRIFLIRSIAK